MVLLLPTREDVWIEFLNKKQPKKDFVHENGTLLIHIS